MLVVCDDLLGLSGVPSLSCDEVALAAPGHGVLTAGLVGVCCLALVVAPEGVVVPIMCTSLVRALLEAGVGAGWLFAEDAGDGGRSNEEVGEGDHFVGLVEVFRFKSSGGWSCSWTWAEVSCLYTRLQTGSG